jgi:circadian clock protein KaiC
VCFRHAAAGGRAAYVTLLAEMHTRMLQHLRSMSFFNEALIPAALYYISAFHTLESAGLKGLIDVLRREIKGHAASLLVLDGLVAAQETAQSDREFKKFINEIQAHAGAHDCTVVLLTSSSLQTVSAEHTMVDGVIELEDRMFGVRSERGLTVRKFRGSAFLRGRHAFQITGDGLQLFPRIEAAFPRPAGAELFRGRLATGVPGLDGRVGGGLPEASATALLGPPGAGKTLFGLQFLSLSTPSEPGLHFGFLDGPAALEAKAASLDIAFGERIQGGELEVIWHPRNEHCLDELAYRLLEAVRRRSVKRLVIDGLEPFLSCATFPDRVGRFMTCLINELRSRGVASVLTLEDPVLPAGAGHAERSWSWLCPLADNVILLRSVERDGEMRRVLSVPKMRDSPHNIQMCGYQISARGISLAESFPSGEPGAGGNTPPPPDGGST